MVCKKILSNILRNTLFFADPCHLRFLEYFAVEPIRPQPVSEMINNNFVILAFNSHQGPVHCYKTEGEIPVPTPRAVGQQWSTTGKYLPHESGVNNCFALAVFNSSRIFP